MKLTLNMRNCALTYCEKCQNRTLRHRLRLDAPNCTLLLAPALFCGHSVPNVSMTSSVGPWLNVAMQAAAQAVRAAEGSDASVPCCGMNGWQSRWLWQRRRTTPHEDRSLPHSHQGGGGPRDARRPTGPEVTSSGAAPRAAAERPQLAALCGGLPPDRWPACTGRGVG